MRECWPDALAAIRWAIEVTGNPGRPYSSRLLDAWKGGSDPADWPGQAGLILRELKPLSGAPLATLVLRAVRVGIRCMCRRDCCSGRRMNPDWREARDVLAAAALAARVGGARWDLRVAVLHRVYERHQNFRRMAQLLEMDEHTVADRAKEIEVWLGVRGSIDERIAGIEPQALARAETILSEAGLLMAST